MCVCENEELNKSTSKKETRIRQDSQSLHKNLRHYEDYGLVTGFFENGTEHGSCIEGRDYVFTIFETLSAVSLKICLVERYTLSTVSFRRFEESYFFHLTGSAGQVTC